MLIVRLRNGLVVIIRPVWKLGYRAWFTHSSVAFAWLRSSFRYSWDLLALTPVDSQELLTWSIYSEASHANSATPTKSCIRVSTSSNSPSSSNMYFIRQLETLSILQMNSSP